MPKSESSLPSCARAVVIGGGVVGCSILYHLAKKGWRDIVLLERRELSCGSSWHAAGQFHIINSNANLSSLQLHTLKFYPQLEKESGQNIGLHRTGGIYLASTPERRNYLIQEQAKNRAQNPEMQFIGLDEAAAMHPLLDKKHFLAALHDPLDGHIDPAGVVQAFAKAARKNGAQIFQQTFVRALTPCKNGEWIVHTEGGDIRAGCVINAAGLWAREVGKMAGVNLPLQAMEHHYLITEPLSAIENLGRELPAMVDFDGNAYGRQEGMGMLLGAYEENGQPWSPRETPWDFGHELLPDDLSRIAPRLETAFLHFPALATAGIRKTVNGPFTFAPDGNALIGPVPGLKNYWSACAVMAGFCQGAGIGKVFADWMVEGEPGMDVFAMDVARFGDFAGRKYTVRKVVENFGRRFMVAYPNEQLPAMRPWRTTALYERFRQQGAVFGTSFGLEHALYFSQSGEKETPTFLRSNAFADVKKEALATRNNVACLEVSNFAKHRITGPGARAFLDSILAGRLPPPGRLRLSPMLSERGKLIGDLSAANLGADENGDEAFMLFGSGAAQAAHQRYFQSLAPDNARVRNDSAALPGLMIAGPHSRRLLSQMTDEEVSAAAFKWMDIRQMEVGGVSALVARVSYTGELGYEIYCAPDYLLALHNAMLAAAKEANLELTHIGAYALMSLRLEKGFGAWGLDFREDFTAAESGLDKWIDWDKPSFVGRAAAEAEAKRGAARCLVLLTVEEGDADAVGDEPVYQGGDYAGFITSGGYGHFLDSSLALAYLESARAEEGGECEVEILGVRRRARITLAPPHDPAAARMRA